MQTQSRNTPSKLRLPSTAFRSNQVKRIARDPDREKLIYEYTNQPLLFSIRLELSWRGGDKIKGGEGNERWRRTQGRSGECWVETTSVASPPVAGAYIDFGPRAAGRRAEGKGRDVASRVEPSRETETETVVEDTRADSSLSFLSLSLFFSRRIQFKIRFERESGKLFLKLSLSDSGFLISEENSRVDLISPSSPLPPRIHPRSFISWIQFQIPSLWEKISHLLSFTLFFFFLISLYCSFERLLSLSKKKNYQAENYHSERCKQSTHIGRERSRLILKARG